MNEGKDMSKAQVGSGPLVMDYDLFVSYCPDDSKRVSSVLKALSSAGLAVFDPVRNHAQMWGLDLKSWFSYVFPTHAKAAMIFWSTNYDKSPLCKRELEYVLESAKENPSLIKVLPIRLDNTQLPPQASDVVFLDIADTTPEQIATLAKARIEQHQDASVGILSDEDLVARIAAERDSEAFAVLYGRTYPTVLRYIRRHFKSADRIGEPEDATDIVLDVLGKVWEQAAKFSSQHSSFEEWIIYLTTRAIVEHEHRIRTDKGVTKSTSGDYLTLKPVSPEEQYLFSEQMSHLMSGLMPKDREVLELYLTGISTNEIAEVLGISSRSSRVRIYRLLSTLRNKLAHLEKA